MTPKQYEPRGAKPHTSASKPRWSKDAATGRGKPAEERPRQARPKSWEAGRPSDAKPGKQRGERPDWTPRGYKADGTDRRAAGRTGAPRTGDDRRPTWEPRREWTPREDRGRDERPATRDFGSDRPRRDHADERPRRDFGSERPRRDFDADRPRRDFGDRPQRDDHRAPLRNARSAEESGRKFSTSRAPQHEPRFGADRDERTAPFVPTQDVVHERLEAHAAAADAGEGIGFGDLGLGDNLVRQLAAMGAAQPFPIQAATIPEVLAGRDVLGRGKTGSGKTIAFGAPVVERLLQAQRGAKSRSMGRRPRAIILAPTRELAQQIDRTVQPLARSVGLFTIAIVGGVPYQKQLMGLSRGADIVIGTPGRILDLISKGDLDLSEIQISVLDEADHMCDLGFLEPVQDILHETPEGSQRLLFSATLDQAVESLVTEFLHDPSVHEVEGEDQASSTITHKVWIVDASAKREFVKELAGSVDRSIVFARTRAFAEELSEILDDAGIRAASLHGDLNQARRNRSLKQLEDGHVRSLVATDVAARGIHVDDVELVIQADMPDDHKTYLHRSGRTGRAGALGTVITVIPPGRRRRMEDLLRNAGIEAEWEDKATTRRPSGDRPYREDRPYRNDRPARPFGDRPERTDRPERKPRMSEAEFAEFQAWKAARDAAAAAPAAE